MFGFSNPVPITISVRPAYRNGSGWNASVKCPSAMMIPPIRTLRYCPNQRSAMNPPMIGVNHTLKT